MLLKLKKEECDLKKEQPHKYFGRTKTRNKKTTGREKDKKDKGTKVGKREYLFGCKQWMNGVMKQNKNKKGREEELRKEIYRIYFRI